MERNTVKDRLIAYLSEKKLSKAEFGRRIMLGHTNIETTQIYAKILAKDVDAQFERLDGLF